MDSGVEGGESAVVSDMQATARSIRTSESSAYKGLRCKLGRVLAHVVSTLAG